MKLIRCFSSDLTLSLVFPILRFLLLPLEVLFIGCNKSSVSGHNGRRRQNPSHGFRKSPLLENTTQGMRGGVRMGLIVRKVFSYFL